MKLHVRSTVTKETLQVEAPDASSLDDLKILITSKLYPMVSPDSIDSPSIAPTRSSPPRRAIPSPPPASPWATSSSSLSTLTPHTLSSTPTLLLVPKNLDSNTPSQKDAILETASPGRCLTVASSSAPTALCPGLTANSSNVKIFVDDIEVTHPDLFNNDCFVIHGIDSFVTPLSPLSCSHGDPHPAFAPELATAGASALPGSAIMRLMLRYAIAAFPCTLAIATCQDFAACHRRRLPNHRMPRPSPGGTASREVDNPPIVVHRPPEAVLDIGL